jgi:hemin uptake protein HemP
MPIETRSPAPTEREKGAMTPERQGPCRPVWSSDEILRGGRLAVILHEGCEYRLQLTRGNKLLLTK